MDYIIESPRFVPLVNNDNVINERRGLISDAATKMRAMIDSGEMIEAQCTVKHRFSDGCYLREIFMPAGTRIIGKIHATNHFNILLTGKVTVITAEGREEMTAPHTFSSKAGVQKVVIVHEDCTWQTVHVTESTDIEEIEKEVIAESYDQLLVDGLLNKSKGLLS